MTSQSQPWRWDNTAQPASDDVKRIVNEHQDQRREALDCSKDVPPIWVTTDGCLTGEGGHTVPIQYGQSDWILVGEVDCRPRELPCA